MFPTSYPLIASLLLSQATALVINGATSTNFPSCQTTPPSMGSSSCLSGRATLSPRDGVTDASQDDHHRVSVILGACLGAAGGVFLIGLGLFWVFLHHRVRTAAGNMQDVVPRSWTPASSVEDSQVHIVTNHPSLSLDLTGAVTERSSAMVPSPDSTEAKRPNKTGEVLDICPDNAPRSALPSSASSSSRHSLPDPIEPYVPSRSSPPSRTLRLHTDVQPGSSRPTSQTETPGRSPAWSVRPLPNLPTSPRPRPVSAKAEEAARESRRGRMPRTAVSVDDMRALRQHARRARARSLSSVRAESLMTEIVQHHDGGADARIDLPPPYHECLQMQAAVSTTHPSASQTSCP